MFSLKLIFILQDKATQLVKQLQESNEKLNQDNNTMMEDMKYLRRRNEELTHNEEECRANEGKINQLQGELNTLKEQAKNLHVNRQQQYVDNGHGMPDGELPDVNPNAVHIIQPALNGTNGWYSNFPEIARKQMLNVLSLQLLRDGVSELQNLSAYKFVYFSKQTLIFHRIFLVKSSLPFEGDILHRL